MVTYRQSSDAELGALLDVFSDARHVLWGMVGLPLIPALLWWLWQAKRSSDKTEGKLL